MAFFRVPFVRIVAAILLAIAVIAVAQIVSETINHALPESLSAQQWISTSVFQLCIAFFSILAMLAVGRGSLRPFGFTWGVRISWVRVALWLIGPQVVIALGFLLCPQSGESHFAADFTFWQTVIGVWLIASTCEEILTRGLVVGYLAPLRDRGLRIGGALISTPVIVGAVLFSVMHVPLLVMGIDRCIGIQILVTAFVIGLVAGTYREKSGSLVPAILVHMGANVVGMGLDALRGLLT